MEVCYWYVEPLMRASNLAVPYAELSAVPHVELQFVRSTGTLLSLQTAPALLPGTFPYLLMLRAYTALGIECSKSVRGKCRELPTLLGDGRNAARLELGTPVTPAVLGLCRM
jgi:hypothetical protein